MSVILAGFLLSLALQDGGGSKTAPPSPAAGVGQSESAGVASARTWLALVDNERWRESWSEAGSLFTSQVTQARWASTIQSVRQPLGHVSARTPQDVTTATSLPGAPDGEYEVVRFRTRFVNKQDAVETVTVVREGAGWKVVGYFIR